VHFFAAEANQSEVGATCRSSGCAAAQPYQLKKAARMSGLFNFCKTPGQAGFGSTAGVAGFLALAAIFLRLM
jgi:hypothetical protein